MRETLDKLVLVGSLGLIGNLIGCKIGVDFKSNGEYDFKYCSRLSELKEENYESILDRIKEYEVQK